MDTDAPTPPRAAPNAKLNSERQFDSESVYVDTVADYMELLGWDSRTIERADLFHVVLIKSGYMTVTLAGKVDVLSAGDVLMIPPSNPFSLSCYPPVEGYVVAATVAEMHRVAAVSELFARFVSAGRIGVFDADPDLRTFALFKTLSDTTRSPTDSGLLDTHVAFCSVVGRIMSEHHNRRALSGGTLSQTEVLVKRFSELIERDYRSQRPLTDYCTALNATERALRRATQRECGLTPLQMIHARSVLEAKRLLRFTTVSVAQIGSALGFEDPAYFNRFFKKALGESPRAWRVGSSDS